MLTYFVVRFLGYYWYILDPWLYQRYLWFLLCPSVHPSEAHFLRKICIMLKIGFDFWPPKLTFLKFCPNLFNRFFWNCTWWLGFLREIHILFKVGVNWFFGIQNTQSMLLSSWKFFWYIRYSLCPSSAVTWNTTVHKWKSRKKQKV